MAPDAPAATAIHRTAIKAKNGWSAQDFALCNENEIASDIIISYRNALS